MEQWKKEIAEIRALMAERERLALEREEREKLREEQERIRWERFDIRLKEIDAMIDKAFGNVGDLRSDINGISESNGQRAENYFFNSLSSKMRFGKYEFDEIEKGRKKIKKMPDGKRLQGEYDVIMYNGNTIALIEIKNRGRSGDITKLIDVQLGNFKIFYPMYADYTFVLGLAADSFEEGVIEEARAKGVGLLMPKGDVVEIIDEHLEVF